MLSVKKLSHASLEIGGWGGTLVTDPWFEGSAFADSWELCEPPAVGSYDALSACTYLWISHGHPDHFSPATLRKIPPVRRSLMKVLILKSQSNQPLVSWFEKHEFEVLQIYPRSLTTLSPGLQIEVGEVHFGDSWMLLSHGDSKILNINDCVLGPGDLRYLSRKAGKLDLLALQYGVANWTGNPADYESRRFASMAVLERVEHYVRKLKPATVLPFASEFQFSRFENHHLNDSQNSIMDVVNLLGSIGQETVLMNNGDTWTRERGPLRCSDAPVCSTSSSPRISFSSEASSASIQPSEFQKLDSVRRGTVATFHGRLRASVYRRLFGLFRVGHLVVEVRETQARWTVTMRDVRPSRLDQDPDFEMSSEMFAELLGKFYGVDNLFIGGRFIRISDNALLKLGVVFGLERLGGMGIKLGVDLLRPALLGSVLRRWRGATANWSKPL